SGTLMFNGRQAKIRGTFDVTGALSVVINQKDGSAISLNLRLERTDPSGSDVVRGTVEWNGTLADLFLSKAPFHFRLNPAPAEWVGSYTMLLPSKPGWGVGEPGGDGWATVSCSRSGAVLVKGKLGDGTLFSETCYLSADGEASLYRNLYRSIPSRGRIGGRIGFRDLAGVSDFDGTLQWTKFADPREARYAEGFDVEVSAIGSRFVPPVPGQRILGQLADAHHNAELSLIGPTAPNAGDGVTDRVLSWQSNDRLVHYGPEKLSGTVSRKNGAAAGLFYDPVTRKKVLFAGVALQKQGRVGGVFVNGSASGAVRILPGEDFTYPGSETAGLLGRVDVPMEPAEDPLEGVEPFAPGVAGLYGGLLTRHQDDLSGTGALEGVKVTAAGAVSGVLWIEGVKLGFKGALDLNGDTLIRIVRKSQPAVVLRLQLVKMDPNVTIREDGFGFAGTVSLDDGVTLDYSVDAQRKPVFTKVERAPQEGGYTLAMRVPDGVDELLEPGGDGYGTMKVGYTGTCTGLVVLAEGTRTSFGGHVGGVYDDRGLPVAEWSFHRGLYGKSPKGYVAGKLFFRRSDGIGDLDGAWHWVKQAGASP
ncbi:MAG: hypothetical protein KDL87_14495, partial [Verrucomicrobiae bacterium]|nr:hypothetical protein [Verrucomicrobiae bacterium]